MIHTITQGNFLNKYSEVLSKRRIFDPNKLNPIALSPKDKQIAEAVINLLTSKTDVPTVAWKTLLMQISVRLKEKAINLWSLNFYHKLDGITH